MKRLAKYPVKFLLSKLESAPNLDTPSISRNRGLLKEYFIFACHNYSTHQQESGAEIMSRHTIASVQTGTFYGFTGIPVRAEVDIKSGLPSIQVIGMAAKSISEARHRVRSALTNAGFQFPARRVIVNLSPAELPKDGAHFDLPIAIGILHASGQILARTLHQKAFAGEVSLNGDVLPVRGITLIAEAAKASGATTLYVPYDNYPHALLIDALTIVPVRTLNEVFRHLHGAIPTPHYKALMATPKDKPPPRPTLDSIRGNNSVKRALTIAIAGRHNLIMHGPPGTGKTLFAKVAASLIPPLTKPEILEVTKLHGLADTSTAKTPEPPLRTPHHSVTRTSLIGGGIHPHPGEISLAHRGILLLDELPEYPRVTLEALRQPLEDRSITLSRLYGSVTYPAHTLLIATMNPCPCGYYGDPRKECRCSARLVDQYRKRLSGPLLDRIDLFVTVPRLENEYIFDSKLLQKNQQATAVGIIKRIGILQNERYNRSDYYNTNATPKEISELFKISNEAHVIARQAQDSLNLSGRALLKTIRVARTIADAAASPTLEAAHIAEALQYRSGPFDT